MLRQRHTNPLVSSFWYPLITPLVFSKLAPCQRWSVHMFHAGSDGNFNFCSNNMPVPFTCLHSDKIRTLRKELKNSLTGVIFTERLNVVFYIIIWYIVNWSTYSWKIQRRNCLKKYRYWIKGISEVYSVLP